MQPQSYMQFAFEAKDSLLSGASGLYQKTKLLWGEVQRIRRRIRRGFERIRMLFGGFAYETHVYSVGF